MSSPPPRPKPRAAGQPMVVNPVRRRQLGRAFDEHLCAEQAHEYHLMRSRYPQAAVDAILALGGTTAAPVIADLGAGTGILSHALHARGATVHAVEPSHSMLEVLTEVSAAPEGPEAETLTLETPGCGRPGAGEPGRLHLHRASAEATGLAEFSVDIVVAAQAWHWFDPVGIQAELQRILKPNGAVAVVGNYLDTSHPWVHRLTRIMRAGDVYRPQWQPELSQEMFTEVRSAVFEHRRQLVVEDIFRLAATLSSWLSADEPQRERRRENLRWYLYEHLGYLSGAVVELPYLTSLHTARRR